MKGLRPIKAKPESRLRVSPAVSAVSPALHKATFNQIARLHNQKSSSPYNNKTNYYNRLATEEAHTNTSNTNNGILDKNLGTGNNGYTGYNHHWPYNNQSQPQSPYQRAPMPYHPYAQNQPNPHRPQNIGEAEYEIHQSSLTKALSSVPTICHQYALPDPLNLLNRMWTQQGIHQQPSYKGTSWSEEIPPTGPSNCQGPSGPPRPNQDSKRIHGPLKGHSRSMQEQHLRQSRPCELFQGQEIHSSQMKLQDLSKGPPGLVVSPHNASSCLGPYNPYQKQTTVHIRYDNRCDTRSENLQETLKRKFQTHEYGKMFSVSQNASGSLAKGW